MTSEEMIRAALRQFAGGGLVTIRGTREEAPALACSGPRADAETVNLMVREGRGLVTVALISARCEELGLMPMSPREQSGEQPAFTVSIEARSGTTTGISAADRARTIVVASDPAYSAADLVEPGHVIPIRVRTGGVLERRGVAEAAVDLARLARCTPAAALCHVLAPDGSVAAEGDLVRLSRRLGAPLISIDDVLERRLGRERLVERFDGGPSLEAGPSPGAAYRSIHDGREHVAWVHGDPRRAALAFLGVHRVCPRGGAPASAACRCHRRLERMQRQARGFAAGAIVCVSTAATSARAHRCCLDGDGLGRGDPYEAAIAAAIVADLGNPALLVSASSIVSAEAISRFGARATELGGPNPARVPLPAEHLAVSPALLE